MKNTKITVRVFLWLSSHTGNPDLRPICSVATAFPLARCTFDEDGCGAASEAVAGLLQVPVFVLRQVLRIPVDTGVKLPPAWCQTSPHSGTSSAAAETRTPSSSQ